MTTRFVLFCPRRWQIMISRFGVNLVSKIDIRFIIYFGIQMDIFEFIIK